MIIQAIVLDFDGVIVESNQIKHQAFSELFSAYPDYFDEIMRYHLSHNAVNRHEKFRYIMEHILKVPYSEKTASRWADDYSNLTRERIIQCPFVSGAPEFLSFFATRFPLYLASATPENELHCIVQGRNLARFFKKIYGAPLKKEKMFEKICLDEGIPPEEILFIGDSIEDYRSAERFGCHFIGRTVNNTFSQTDTLQFRDLHDILEYLKKNLNEIRITDT